MFLHNNSCRGFCISELQYGSPLSFTGEYQNDFPVVRLYDGTNYCGVSNETVVSIDNYSPSYVMQGGVININRIGFCRIKSHLIVNFESAEFNRYIEPTIVGWRIQKKKTDSSVGIISLKSDSFIEVNLF